MASDNEWSDAPQWVRELMALPGEDGLKREIAKLRMRVGKLESYDDKLSKRVWTLEQQRPPTLDAAMDKAADEEIGKLRALVLKGGSLVVRIQQVVCAHLCDDSAGPTKHHPDCLDARQWLADCRAEGLE